LRAAAPCQQGSLSHLLLLLVVDAVLLEAYWLAQVTAEPLLLLAVSSSAV
jgi:hypothetical protein